MLNVKNFEDQNTLERIRANDRTVLGELFLQLEKLVFSYVMTHGGKQEDADDVLQESIVVLWQKAVDPEFVLTSRLSTYVMAIAKNKWRAESRKKGRSNGQLPDDLLAEENSLLDNMMHNEQLDRVRRGLDRIHADCKQLLMLFYFEERPLKEIAGIMKFANPDVAKSKKYQCKKALEKAVKTYVTETERKN
ncbi:MAG: RNA polymerase sigma factor [Calditrichia bacterium]